jgi:primosomal protein N' (replication factor Y) (superfamily II helicase)
MNDFDYVEAAFNIPVYKNFTYTCDKDSPCARGCRIVANVGRRSLTGYVIRRSTERPADLPPEITEIKPVTRVIDSEPLFGDEFIELAKWISEMYLCSLGESLAKMVPGGRRESEIPSLGTEETAFLSPKIELSDEQQKAIECITGKLEGRFYLFGITGSGKTEVFLNAAEKTIAEGRSVIYLVPEISLTNQVVEAIYARFQKNAAVLHSRLTPSQRLTEWRRIITGQAALVVGARSAVFAPVNNLGLIILDEEHEGSYKAGSTPRYHARQVAMHRCSSEKARLVMGSATPSVEAYHLMNSGKLVQIELTKRLSGGNLPQITVIDLNGQPGVLSKPLVDEIKHTSSIGMQSILFLNRRGFSYFFHCKYCGYNMECRRCSVSLTFHKNRNRMVCHYCGYNTKPISTCPECGSLDVGYSGFGTERIEEEVKLLFPDLRIARIDSDSIRKKGSLEKILIDFRQKKIDILLGTQMVAKGLNFPGVRLVGIVLADTGLHLPDFRAAERTFALIVQVSGRAGRFVPDGKVFVQSFLPQNDAVDLAARGLLHEFYTAELENRRMLRFPPFSRIIRIVIRGKNRGHVIASVNEVSSFLNRNKNDDVEILGPAECALALVSGNYRQQLILRSNQLKPIHRLCSSLVSRYRTPSGIYMETDVDPVSLL